MNLISIGSPNALINADNIDYIEQRTVGITSVTYICIGGKEFMLGIPLEELYKNIGIGVNGKHGQEFGG
jgi:hypothetical protein